MTDGVEAVVEEVVPPGEGADVVATAVVVATAAIGCSMDPKLGTLVRESSVASRTAPVGSWKQELAFHPLTRDTISL